MSMLTGAQKFLTSPMPGASMQPIDDFDMYVVTPADGADLPSGLIGGQAGTRPTTWLYITGAGNVAVNLFGGGTATLTGLAAGQWLNIGVTRVLATGTTATGILAVY